MSTRRGAVETTPGVILTPTQKLTNALLNRLGSVVARVGANQVGDYEIAEVPWAKVISGVLSGTKTLTFSGATVLAKSQNFVAADPAADPPVAGVGWCLYGDGTIKMYAGEFGGTIKVAGFVVGADGSVTIGSGATKFIASPDGSFRWGDPDLPGTGVKIDVEGRIFGGADVFADAIWSFDQAGNFVLRNTAQSMHYISLGAIDATMLPPDFFPRGGAFVDDLDVILSAQTQGSQIFYTDDGTTDPTAGSGTLYTGAIHLTGDTTIKAAARKLGVWSDVVEYSFNETGGVLSIVPNPIANPTGGSYSPTSGSLTVNLSDSLAGASIRYNVGTVAVPPANPTSVSGTLIAPANGSTPPSANISLASGQRVVKMIAYKAGLTDSTVVTETYAITTGGGGTGGGGSGGGRGGVVLPH